MDFKTERDPWDELDPLCSTQFSGINFFKSFRALVELVSFFFLILFLFCHF